MMFAPSRWSDYVWRLMVDQGVTYAALSVLLRAYGVQYSPSFLCRVVNGARALPANPQFLHALALVLSPYDQMPIFFLVDRLPSGMGGKLLDIEAEAECAKLRASLASNQLTSEVWN